MASQDANKREQELAKKTFQRVEQLFHATYRMTPAEREAYLLREGVSDVMRDEVACLLDHDGICNDAFDKATISVSGGLEAAVDADASVMASVGPGTILGDFRLIKEIGRGGMAVVYRAIEISLDRTVALKILCFPLTTAAVRQRFRREAAACAAPPRQHCDSLPLRAAE